MGKREQEKGEAPMFQHTATEVTAETRDGKPDGYSVTNESGWTLWTRWKSGLRKPRKGDTYFVYMEPGVRWDVGYPRIGLDWLIDGQVVEIERFKTKAERERERQLSIAKRLRHEDAQYAKHAEQMEREIDALPGPFQQRIANFRWAKPRFNESMLSYELFACKEAVKFEEIIARLDPNDFEAGFQAFDKLSYDEQLKLGMADGHSGNTFGFSMRLARAWHALKIGKSIDTRLISEDHGAMVGLMGCVDAGCAKFSSHDKAFGREGAIQA